VVTGFVFSCRAHPISLDPSFRCSFTINNPSKGLLLSATICPNPHTPSAGIFYVDVSRYREKNVLRKGLADTADVGAESFAKFRKLVRDAKLMDRIEDMVGRADGNVYHFEVRDSSQLKIITVIGQPSDGGITNLINFYTGELENKFPRIAYQDLQSKIELTISNRIRLEAKFSHIEIVKNDSGMTWDDGRIRTELSDESYLDLWRVAENNDVWKLPADRGFEKKYPIEYILKIQRGSDSSGWTVFAPSRLTDKRYYSIITRIETIGMTQPD
jgi:hypothetical protein